jgi:hypothetical protein
MSDLLTTGRDRGGSIAVAGAMQVVAAANDGRKRMTFQNTSDADMRLSETDEPASETNGYIVGPREAVEISTNRSVTVWCASAGKTFEATEA